MKIKAYEASPASRLETISICYYKNTNLEKAIGPAVCGGGSRLSRRRQHPDPVRPRTWMRTMWPFPSLLAVSAVQQHLVRTKKAHGRVPDSGERRAPGGSSFCHAAGLRRLRRQPLSGTGDASSELIDEDLLDKDYYAAVNDYNDARSARHRQDRLQDGHLHHPVLSGQPRFLRRSVSSQEVIDQYFTNTVSRVGGITLKDIAAEM